MHKTEKTINVNNGKVELYDKTARLITIIMKKASL